MTIEQELPLLLDELANSHAVGGPPELGDVVVTATVSYGHTWWAQQKMIPGWTS
jgi:hypothetical protein